MTCQKCNFQNEETAKFCRNCGEKLNKITEVKPQQPKKIQNGFGVFGATFSTMAVVMGISIFFNVLNNSELLTTSPEMITIFGLGLLGLILSFIGIFKKDQTKWQAITGLVLSGITVVILIFFIYRACDNENVAIAIEESPKEGVVIKGTKWATRNVGERGTFVSQPHYLGNHYTWEEAQDVCPAGWRLPTEEEIKDLLYAPNRWITINGVKGRAFGTPPNVIFLPAAGYRYSDGRLDFASSHGSYWSSAAFENGSYSCAYSIGFHSNGADKNGSFRSHGLSLRVVAE